MEKGAFEDLKMHFLRQELVISMATFRFKVTPPFQRPVRRTTWGMVAVCCGKMVAWNWSVGLLQMSREAM